MAVLDQGTGLFPRASPRRPSRPFVRGRRRAFAADRGAGHGLGLTIVRRVVEGRTAGSVFARNVPAPDGGAEVGFRVAPRARPLGSLRGIVHGSGSPIALWIAGALAIVGAVLYAVFIDFLGGARTDDPLLAAASIAPTLAPGDVLVVGRRSAVERGEASCAAPTRRRRGASSLRAPSRA